MAGLHPAPSLRGNPGISAARPAVRPRHCLMDANLVRRIGFAVIAIPLALGVVWYGGLPLAFVVALVAALAIKELFGLAARQGIRPARALGYVTAATLPPLTYATLVTADVRALLTASWAYLFAVWLV